MNDRLFVDIHVIETLPPSCVNRDDLGSPKTAYYGGVTRARVSSQAWKRAVRTEFSGMQMDVGKRTRHILNMVTDEISAQAPDIENPEELAKNVIENAGFSFSAQEKGEEKEEKKEKTNVLFFVSQGQVRELAEIAVDYGIMKKPEKGCRDKNKKAQYKEYTEKLKNALKNNNSADIALFGRMLAEDKDLNVNAAAQVAHAISTHEVHNEFDYFTAVDDCDPNEGAGHLGTAEFNSSTMYRYATVNGLELNQTLGVQTPCVIRAFVEAFIRSMPTGKQNSFANRVRPDAVCVTVRRDQPVNLVGAFEKPIHAGKDGYVEKSIERLVRYAQETYDDYYGKPELSLVIGGGMEDLGEKRTLPALLDELEQYLSKTMPGKEQE